MVFCCAVWTKTFIISGEPYNLWFEGCAVEEIVVSGITVTTKWPFSLYIFNLFGLFPLVLLYLYTPFIPPLISFSKPRYCLQMNRFFSSLKITQNLQFYGIEEKKLPRILEFLRIALGRCSFYHFHLLLF